MVRPNKRRYSNVLHAKHLIDAIVFIRQQKQIPNIDRIARYMKRIHNHTQHETEKQLQYAVKDNLILSYHAVGKKGNMTGVEQEGYRLPDEEDFDNNKDGHDWYCFECHTQGDVLPCSDCWRVFHPSCTEEEWTGPKFTCTICKEIESGRKKNKMKRKMLNTLLSYTILRMKEKTRELHKIGHREQEMSYERYFIFCPMDLNNIEEKVESNKYRSLEEFVADTQLIYHNIYLMYGDEVKMGMTELAKIMARDCKYDVEEIKQCQHCYYMSNAKPKDWFCEPCDPPHELVYAKLKGYSYWPAKIIRKDDDKFDVRFFGGFHQRSLLPGDQIKPITSNLKTLVGNKRTAGFIKACKELSQHQERLAERAAENLIEEEEDDDDHSDHSSGKVEEDEESNDEGDSGVNGHLDNSALEVSSTSVSPARKKPRLKAPSLEDTNVVTSSIQSEEKINIPKVITHHVSVQTQKKHTKSQHSQTETEEPSSPVSTPTPSPPVATVSIPTTGKCSCDEKYNKKFNDYKEKLEKEHKEEKEKAIKEQSERLKKDFEEDKQQAVSRAMANMNREIERAKRQTEEKCKGEYMEEMKKLAQKHKEAISQTKKKQWCYNCEEEAMYHCCWNTSYCSVKCQQDHWHKEHKRVCRRKR